MTQTITIRRGLRRLEFSPPDPKQSGLTHVIVEFAQSEPLAQDQPVRIPLGVREGIERTLEGLPQALSSARAGRVYRLEGDVP